MRIRRRGSSMQMRGQGWSELGRALRYAWQPGLLVAGSLAAVLHTAALLALPWMVGRLLDESIIGGRAELLLPYCLLLAALAVALVATRQARLFIFTYLGERSLVRLRRAMLERLQGSPMALFEKEASGALTSRFVQDAPAMAGLYNPLLGEAIYNVVQLVAILVVVAYSYGSLIWVAAGLIPFYVFMPLMMARPTRAAAQRVLESRAQVNAGIQETIGVVREIKTFTMGAWNASRQGQRFRDVLEKTLRLALVRAVFSINYAVYWIAVAFVYWLGGRQVLNGTISLGELIALVWYLGYLDGPASGLATLYGKVQVALGSAERVFGVLDEPPEEAAPALPSMKVLGTRVQSVEFEDVTFRYPGQERTALAGVSLRVEPGQRLALVGPSGAGKSTMASLLLRLYEPQQGRVLIGGHDIRQMTLQSLRTQVSAVFQESVLLAVSIRENIALGTFGASQVAIEDAARRANAHDFIVDLPEGYDTLLGERGLGLSVGQRQRLAIARVILRDPRVLILDEATSALDAESESLVQEALENLMHHRTSIVIAHRLATVVEADSIAVLDRGRIVAQGDHQGLLRASPLYRKLATLQWLGQDDGAEAAGDPADEARLIRGYSG